MPHPLLDLARSLRACLQEGGHQKLDDWTDDELVETVRRALKLGLENFYREVKNTFENRLGKDWRDFHQKFLRLNKNRIAEVMLSNEVDP